MDDVNAPLTALLTSKPAFGGTTEAFELSELTDAELKRGSVSWLEVGAGDGSNLGFQLDRLTSGRIIDVVAIDPAAVTRPDRRGVKWIRARVEDYSAERRFDWINLRHSVYYLSDAIGELTRLAGMLVEGGTLALTHWSRDCILHRIHRHVCGDPDAASLAAIEDIASQLSNDTDFAVSTPVFHESCLDVDRLLRDRSLRVALLNLARRGRPALSAPPEGDPDILISLLRTIRSPDVRRNGILLLRVPHD